VYKESIPGGMFRYTAGVYNNLDRVKADRAKVNVLGIADAFVSAYLNGQRIKISDATEKIAQGNVQLMSENPIVFPQGGAPANIAPANNNSPAVNTVQPFTNGVSQGPAPTPENGVKTSEEGITYKVQIGAYSKQIPVNIADNWMKIKTWPISYSQINNLYIYTVGSFSEARFAKKLKDEMVALGITDAFVIVLKDGKKLYGTEASQYLNR
jgi:cell division septation protein DedD